MLHSRPSAAGQLGLLSYPVASATWPLLTISSPSIQTQNHVGFFTYWTSLIIQIIHYFLITQSSLSVMLAFVWPEATSFSANSTHLKVLSHAASHTWAMCPINTAVTGLVLAQPLMSFMQCTPHTKVQTTHLIYAEYCQFLWPGLPTCCHTVVFLYGSAKIKIVWIGLYSTGTELQYLAQRGISMEGNFLAL